MGVNRVGGPEQARADHLIYNACQGHFEGDRYGVLLMPRVLFILSHWYRLVYHYVEYMTIGSNGDIKCGLL